MRALTAEAAVANGITKRERQAINSESLPGIIEQTVSGPALKAMRARADPRARTFKAVPLTSAMIIVPTRLPSAGPPACLTACERQVESPKTAHCFCFCGSLRGTFLSFLVNVYIYTLFTAHWDNTRFIRNDF